MWLARLMPRSIVLVISKCSIQTTMYGITMDMSLRSYGVNGLVLPITVLLYVMYPLVHSQQYCWPFLKRIFPSPFGIPYSSTSPLYHPDLPQGVVYTMLLTTELQLPGLARLVDFDVVDWESCLNFPDSSASHQWQRSRIMFHPLIRFKWK